MMADISFPIYGEVYAKNGDKIAPNTLKVEQGWVQEMMPFQYENWLQNRQDVAITYLLQKGIPEYNAAQEYIANKSVVLYVGVVYLATTSGLLGLPTDTSQWRKLSVTLDSNGAVPVASGGTGASTPSQARTNLGLGTASTLNADFVVQKDVDGNFSAGVITATLAGNSTTSSSWLTGRTISLSGAVTATSSPWKGDGNLTITATSVDATKLTGTIPSSSLSNAVTKTSNTGVAKLPKGTTNQRPSSGTEEFGDFRANETNTLLEYWNGTNWVNPSAYTAEYVLSRANHTGTQPASTITGLSVGASFTTVPATNQGPSIVVTVPHLRFMVWDGTKYVRAPWHSPGKLSYFLRDVPAGHIEVRSDVVLNKADFPDLAEYLGVTAATFVLDEARGEFLRSLDSGRGKDAGRVVGSHQGDAIRNIMGKAAPIFMANASSRDGAIEVTPIGPVSLVTNVGQAQASGRIEFDASYVVPTAAENRPTNIAYRLAVQY